MTNTAIKVENLSKVYRLGEIGTGTISKDMERWFKTKILKQEDPFLKIGEINDRANKSVSDIVYSLRGINFEIKQGDAVGIIGRNGAGKSTLLKILSRVTTPSVGNIKIKGRVASLLEVGTGFHPELSGRENIYLNGAILGMRKREIDRKLDEIIDFSGVERYIDTPVKRYSSGMYVRLAFAVAAHLESEILIVDEVLAVGDAEFQKKCLGKMGEVSAGEGRTVLFVSHNMAAVQSLCGKGILLSNGSIELYSDMNKVTKQYIYKEIEKSERITSLNGLSFKLIDYPDGAIIDDVSNCDELLICIQGLGLRDKSIGMTLFDEDNQGIFSAHIMDFENRNSSATAYYIRVPTGILKTGNFRLEAAVDNDQNECVLKFKKTFSNSNFLNVNDSKGLLMLSNWTQRF